MNETLNLYAKLLRTFLKAGIAFGIVFGLVFGVLTNWRLGLISGISAGLIFWLGVSGILLILSVIRKRSHHGAAGDERLQSESFH